MTGLTREERVRGRAERGDVNSIMLVKRAEAGEITWTEAYTRKIVTVCNKSTVQTVLLNEPISEEHKRQHGQYFTKGNCFALAPFKDWFNAIPNHKQIKLVEPYAGGGSIPRLMKEAGFKNAFVMYDIDPQSKNVIQRDSIANCPEGDCIVTNPPYLAKNSATRRGLNFPETHHDDLYKLSLEKMLGASKYVAAIIPESFITSGLFLNRASKIISLKMKMFTDTECPVCLALFSEDSTDVEIYDGEKFIGTLSELKSYIPNPKTKHAWKFNIKGGEIGILALDNQKTDTIRFVRGEEISDDDIKESSRAITKVAGSGDYNVDNLIAASNRILKHIRENTHDVSMTSFKGLRQDGKYRRRLDFELAKTILNCAMGEM